MNRCKYTLIKRSKKYDYKVFEEQRYNDIIGYEYSYFITNYNETDTIMSSIIDYKDVEQITDKLKNNKESEMLKSGNKK